MNRNSVRIIGGAWRGRKIEFPDLPGLRPTPDRVRETVFNWLQHEVTGAVCLDLFAGSGALGFEALSRGASRVIWVEKSAQAARKIEEQLARLARGAPSNARIVTRDAENWLAGAPRLKFDLVFVDPPFGEQMLPRVLTALAAGGWVDVGSLIYLECERSGGMPVVPPGWELVKSKSAGEVGYHLARVNDRPRS
jgi:16S rRNA (guanine966-N2)-methyltransferase